jgi:hypothetical protein
MATDFVSTRNAAVGAATLAITVPAGAKEMTIYSSVAAILHKTGATAATAGQDVPAATTLSAIPVGFGAGTGASTLTLTAATGNLAVVSFSFSR